uniref:1-phosphatidylinositol-3-phosphate 5-kinase n=1 Tax=Ditylum brightwellii TaxID=49249 RepID=A0A7S1Z8Z8_9STRA
MTTTKHVNQYPHSTTNMTNSFSLSQPTSPSSSSITTSKKSQLQTKIEREANKITSDSVTTANRRLGIIAAKHLEALGKELLESDCPLLMQELKWIASATSIRTASAESIVAERKHTTTDATISSSTKGENETNTFNNSNNCKEEGKEKEDESKKRTQILINQWVDVLMMLATRCCATVNPNVKKGDLLDIRPYCKIKVIAGGSINDCAYMSGIVFHKNVSHKKMARVLNNNPRIMLLSGGIEFTRTENRIASLDTLLEQEEKYMEILVTKIIKLRPDVLLVGRSVSRKAQELLLESDIVLIQHVKSSLMGRIARQTGATVLSSTDHVMSQFGTSVMGKCRRFRLVTFRDNNTWLKQHFRWDPNNEDTSKDNNNNNTPHYNGEDDPMFFYEPKRSISSLLNDPDMPNHERQAILAANELGDGVLDGYEAVRCGLAKRGVARTYIMIEGCPKHLGCTIVLRGATRQSLKQVKRVFRFLVNVAYNLKLETSYFRERCAKLPISYNVPTKQICSSSLCVDYGQPPHGRKVRPWNGGKSESTQRSISGKITAFDHQSILITSVWMAGKTQCCPAEVKGICYYSLQDVSLGQFLRDSCFNLSLKCQNQSCKKSVLDHSLSFIHNDGLINITVEHMDDPLPPAPLENPASVDAASTTDKDKSSPNKQVDSPIATWSYCSKCAKVVTPLVYISDDTWKFSFGKFLEVFFYNRDALLNAPDNGCDCQLQTCSTLYFGCDRLAARFSYEKIKPFGVFVRRSLPIEESFHRKDSLLQLEHISISSSELFAKYGRHIENVSREARSLFGSAVNKPEHLQTVLSELNSIGSEVDHAKKILQEKIASVTKKWHIDEVKNIGESVDELFCFPWQARRKVFMLISAWNERLSAAGQTLTAMRKLAASSSSSGGGVRGDIGPAIGGDSSMDDVMEGMKRIGKLQELYSQYNIGNMFQSTSEENMTFDNHTNRPHDFEYHDVQDDMDYDDEFDSECGDYDIDFGDEVDADVMASRQRLDSDAMASKRRIDADVLASKRRLQQRSKKPSGNRRQEDVTPSSRSLRQTSVPPQFANSHSLGYSTSNNPYDNLGTRDHTQKTGPSSQQTSKSKTVSAGGAVKSALNRFFNRGSKEQDPYKVEVNIFGEGRPRLEPGVAGVVIPVFDDQPSTVIAHSLSSNDYDVQFKHFLKSNGGSEIHPSDQPFDEVVGNVDISKHGRHDRHGQQSGDQTRRASQALSAEERKKKTEHQMLVRNKTHIKHTFRDFDEKGQQVCKFVCTTYWATQFHAVRQAFLSASPSSGGKDQNSGSDNMSMSSAERATFDLEKSYIRSLAASHEWAVSGGKSGASFSRTADGRFVTKCISRTELQMFLDCAPAYFEYLSKAFFHGLPTVLCKIVGVYQIGYHNRVTGKRTMEQVAVMQNIFYERKISKVFDLKGSLRGRFAQLLRVDKDKAATDGPVKSQVISKRGESSDDKGGVRKERKARRRSPNQSTDSESSSDYNSENQDEDYSSSDQSISEEGSTYHSQEDNEQKKSKHVESDQENKESSTPTLLDGDFLEFTAGRPLPLNDRAKAIFHMSILNVSVRLYVW